MSTAIDAYYLQAIGVALAIIFAFSQNRKIDLFPLIATGTWLIGICAIYFRYGLDQVIFYSNDQEIHQRIIRTYLENEGFILRSAIQHRYLITYPTFLLSKIGFDEVLVLKTIQILSLIGIYFKSKSILSSKGMTPKFWHFVFMASPLLFFFSLLALRDLTLALFTVSYVFANKFKNRAVFSLLIFLLKPHLAIALLFGTFALFVFQRFRPRFQLFSALIFVSASYVVGSFSYSVGSLFRDGFFPGLPSDFFSQTKIFQVFLNFSGLQFFSLLNDKDSIVATPTHFLLLARIILFDTFLIPLSFVVVVTFCLRELKRESFLVFMSFSYYLGLVSQTDFNSTRQNIPFLAAMGIVAVVNIEAAKSSRRRNLLLQP